MERRAQPISGAAGLFDDPLAIIEVGLMWVGNHKIPSKELKCGGSDGADQSKKPRSSPPDNPGVKSGRVTGYRLPGTTSTGFPDPLGGGVRACRLEHSKTIMGLKVEDDVELVSVCLVGAFRPVMGHIYVNMHSEPLC
jgi:hypothetical protein